MAAVVAVANAPVQDRQEQAVRVVVVLVDVTRVVRTAGLTLAVAVVDLQKVQINWVATAALVL
jgi:hypothetical protein